MYINKKTLEVVNDEKHMRDYKGKKDWFHCDDLLVPPILELHKKGYLTTYSTIGSPNIIQDADNKTTCNCCCIDNVMMIEFENWVKFYKLPFGWDYTVHDGIACNRVLCSPTYDTYDFTYYANYKHKIDKLGLLMSWIEDLPNYKDVITDECKIIRNFFKYIRSDKAYKEFKERYITEGKVENHNNTRLFRSIYDIILQKLTHSDFERAVGYERLYYDIIIPFYIDNAKNIKHSNLKEYSAKCANKILSEL